MIVVSVLFILTGFVVGNGLFRIIETANKVIMEKKFLDSLSKLKTRLLTKFEDMRMVMVYQGVVEKKLGDDDIIGIEPPSRYFPNINIEFLIV
jgi:hypothetical protein